VPGRGMTGTAVIKEFHLRDGKEKGAAVPKSQYKATHYGGVIMEKILSPSRLPGGDSEKNFTKKGSGSHGGKSWPYEPEGTDRGGGLGREDPFGSRRARSGKR